MINVYQNTQQFLFVSTLRNEVKDKERVERLKTKKHDNSEENMKFDRLLSAELKSLQ